MPEPLLYFKATGAAAIVSATCVLTMFAVRRTVSTTSLGAASALGLGLGSAVGYGMLSLQLSWPPASGLDRLLTIVIPATLGIELIAGLECVPSPIAWLLRMSVAATVPRVLLHGSVYLNGSGDPWTTWQAGIVLAVCSVLLAGVWTLLSWLSQRSPGVSIPLALGLTIQCAGIAVMMAGYIKGGAAAFPMVATLVATTLGAGWITKRTAVSGSAAGLVILAVGVVGLFGVLFIGRFFGRISTACALVMLLAPLLCWVSESRWLRHGKPWLVGSIRLALVSIPLVVVLVAAKRDFDREMSPLLGQARRHATFDESSSRAASDSPFAVIPPGGARRSIRRKESIASGLSCSIVDTLHCR